jgi:hypothetical protein
MARGQSKLPPPHHLTTCPKHPAAPVPILQSCGEPTALGATGVIAKVGTHVPVVTPKFHRTSFYNFFFFR